MEKQNTSRDIFSTNFLPGESMKEFDYKSKSVLEYIELLNSKNIPFDDTKLLGNGDENSYSTENYVIIISNAAPDIDITVHKKNNTAVFMYTQDSKSEYLHFRDMNYYKENGEFVLKYNILKNIEFKKARYFDGAYDVKSADKLCVFTMHKNIEKDNGWTEFETKFDEQKVSNLSIQERYEGSDVVCSAAYFRAFDNTTKRMQMQNIDITFNEGYSTVTISSGYRNKFTFEVAVPDGSILHIFDPEYMFQVELTLDTEQYDKLQFIRNSIQEKLELYHLLGGKNHKATIALQNIKSKR